MNSVLPWFRVYHELLDDPKAQALPPPLFKSWVNLLCLANRQPVRGVLPSVPQIAFGLRISETDAVQIIAELKSAGLLDANKNGSFSPHNWNGRQYQSDNTTARTKRFRERSGNADGNVSANVPGNVARNGTGTFTGTPPESESESELPPNPPKGEPFDEGGRGERTPRRRREPAPDVSPMPYAAPLDAERRAHYEQQAALDGERRRAAREVRSGAGVAVVTPVVPVDETTVAVSGECSQPSPLSETPAAPFGDAASPPARRQWEQVPLPLGEGAKTDA